MEGILCLAMEGEGILPQKTHRGELKAVLAVAVQGVSVWQNSGCGGRKACYVQTSGSIKSHWHRFKCPLWNKQQVVWMKP